MDVNVLIKKWLKIKSTHTSLNSGDLCYLILELLI